MREPSPILGLRAALILLVVIAIAPVFAVVVQGSLAEQRVRLQRAEASLKSVVDLAADHQGGAAAPAAALDLGRALEHLREMSYGAHSTLLVVDASGVVRSRAGSAAVPEGGSLGPGFLRDAVTAARAAAGRAAGPDGRQWLFAVQPAGSGHRVAGLTPVDEVLAPAAGRGSSPAAC